MLCACLKYKNMWPSHTFMSNIPFLMPPLLQIPPLFYTPRISTWLWNVAMRIYVHMILSKEAWHTVSIPIHTKSVRRGWVEGSVQVIWVLVHQPLKTTSLWMDLALCTVALSCRNRFGPLAASVILQHIKRYSRLLDNSNIGFTFLAMPNYRWHGQVSTYVWSYGVHETTVNVSRNKQYLYVWENLMMYRNKSQRNKQKSKMSDHCKLSKNVSLGKVY